MVVVSAGYIWSQIIMAWIEQEGKMDYRSRKRPRAMEGFDIYPE